MNDQVVVDLFVEDRAHEEFLKPLLARVAREEHVEVWSRVRSASGGHGRALREFKLYQHIMEKGAPSTVPADLVVVAIDGNCSTFEEVRKSIRNSAIPTLSDRLVVACPDPHIERWYLADPQSFEVIVGHRPSVAPKKCVRDRYKQVLATSIRSGGHPAPLGGIEFARELVAEMDLYRAGKADSSLGAFLDDLRDKFKLRSIGER